MTVSTTLDIKIVVMSNVEDDFQDLGQVSARAVAQNKRICERLKYLYKPVAKRRFCWWVVIAVRANVDCVSKLLRPHDYEVMAFGPIPIVEFGQTWHFNSPENFGHGGVVQIVLQSVERRICQKSVSVEIKFTLVHEKGSEDKV